MALEISTEQPREEWAAYDLVTNDGVKVEVKSAAYVQSWKQTKPSKISFSIRKTTGFDEHGKLLNETPGRQANVYVFCLLAVNDEKKGDPMNLDHWNFFIQSNQEIEKHWGEQASISLSPLKRVCGDGVDFLKVKSKINELIHQME